MTLKYGLNSMCHWKLGKRTLNYAKTRFNEKTSTKAVQRILLKFPSQEKQIADLNDRNAQLMAELKYYKKFADIIKNYSDEFHDEVENQVKLYRKLTNTSPMGDQLP